MLWSSQAAERVQRHDGVGACTKYERKVVLPTTRRESVEQSAGQGSETCSRLRISRSPDRRKSGMDWSMPPAQSGMEFHAPGPKWHGISCPDYFNNIMLVGETCINCFIEVNAFFTRAKTILFEFRSWLSPGVKLPLQRKNIFLLCKHAHFLLWFLEDFNII